MKMDDQQEIVSEICEFYNGQVVFVTGGTGSLGKLIVEKLLRICTGVKTVYLLVRPKKEKLVNERFEQIFDSTIFDILKDAQPDFRNKVKLIPGDCSKPDLGLSDEDADLLIENVTCIFHAAATVRFDQSLKTATYINARAVKDLLRLAKSMTKLKAMVHISTAYSHCPRRTIDEEFYDVPLSGSSLLEVVDTFSDNMLEKKTPSIIKSWPNTYVFTKAIAEDIIQKEAGDLPLAIVRPAMVTSVEGDPLPGWADNIYGPIGVVLGASLGAIRIIQAKEENVADLVPADYVVNIILAAAWDIGQQNETEGDNNNPNEVLENRRQPKIYNYVSSSQNPITWGRFCDTLEDVGWDYYSVRSIWYYFFVFASNTFSYRLGLLMLHTIPSYIVDGILFLMGKERIMVQGYKKIEKFLGVISYFAMRQWDFSNNNVQGLWTKLNHQDQNIFNFDIRILNWRKYCEMCIIGGRVYLAKDPLTTLSAGIRRRRILAAVHYTLLALLSYGLYLALYHIVSPLFEFLGPTDTVYCSKMPSFM